MNPLRSPGGGRILEIGVGVGTAWIAEGIGTTRAERFGYLERDGVEVMIQEAAGPARRFRTAPLEPPCGRGVNFQLRVEDCRLSRRAGSSHASSSMRM